MELKLPLLLYDAECPLCVRFKQGLERLDAHQRVQYVPLQEERVFSLFPQLDREACRLKVHYLREDGGLLVGGEVVTELLKHYPGIEKLSWLLESGVGRKAVDFFYQQVETYRKKALADKESCERCPTE